MSGIPYHNPKPGDPEPFKWWVVLLSLIAAVATFFLLCKAIEIPLLGDTVTISNDPAALRVIWHHQDSNGNYSVINLPPGMLAGVFDNSGSNYVTGIYEHRIWSNFNQIGDTNGIINTTNLPVTVLDGERLTLWQLDGTNASVVTNFPRTVNNAVYYVLVTNYNPVNFLLVTNP